MPVFEALLEYDDKRGVYTRILEEEFGPSVKSVNELINTLLLDHGVVMKVVSDSILEKVEDAPDMATIVEDTSDKDRTLHILWEKSS